LQASDETREQYSATGDKTLLIYVSQLSATACYVGILARVTELSSDRSIRACTAVIKANPMGSGFFRERGG